MNKKFSTLVALALATGSFMTVDAAVKLVASPAAGQPYIIGTGLSGATPSVLGIAAAATPAASTVTASGDVTIAFTTAAHWQFVAVGEASAKTYKLTFDGHYLALDVEGTGWELVDEADAATTLTLAEGENAGKFSLKAADDKFVGLASIVAGSAEYLYIVGADAAVATGETPVAGTDYVISTVESGTGKSLEATYTPAYTAIISTTLNAEADAATTAWEWVAAGDSLVLKLGKSYVGYDGTKLLAVTEQAKAAKFKLNSDVLSNKYGTTSKDLKFGASGATITLETKGTNTNLLFAQFDAPYSGGVDGIVVNEKDSVITIANTTTTINAAIYLKLGDKFVSVKTNDDGAHFVELLDAVDNTSNEKSQRASWVLKDGKYTSEYLVRKGENSNALVLVNNGSSLRAEYTGFALGYEGTPFAFSSDKLKAGAGAGAVYVGLDADGKVITDATAGNISTTVSVKLSATISAPVLNAGYDNQPLVTSIADTYYLLSDGVNGFVTIDADGTVSIATKSNDPASLWKPEVKKLANGTITYAFKNKAFDKQYLTIGDKVFTSVNKLDYNGSLALMVGNEYLTVNAGTQVPELGTSYTVFGLYEAGLTHFTVKELLNKLGAGFDMTIDTEKDADAVIEGNPFTGILKPVSDIAKDGDDYEAVEFTTSEVTRNTQFLLQTADGKFIALDKNATWSEKTANLNGKTNNRGYKFVTLTAKQAYDDLQATTKEYRKSFCVSHSAAIDAADTKDLVLSVYDESNSEFGRLYVATVNKENLLTTSNFINQKVDEVWPYTIFGGSNLTDLKTLVKKSFWTIVNANVVNEDNNGKAYAIPAGAKEGTGIVPTTGGAYMDTTNVLLTSPEAQWAPTVDANGKLVLTNRENPDVKIIGWSLYNVDAAKGIYTVAGTKDTINISLVDRSKLDGFASYGENYLKNTEFNMAIETLLGNAYMSENHAGKHQIGLVDNVAGAATWKLEKEFAGRPDSKTATDSVYVISKIGYFADNKWKTVDDTLAILPYVIKNVANGEYIKYSTAMNGYICDDSKAKASAQRFALKMKPDNTFNLVEITPGEDFDGVLADNKMFGGVSAKEGLVNRIGKYNQTENDRVVILPLDAPEYRKLAMGDTIKVYRSESTDEAQVLFEQGEFLSIQNAVQFPKINPAMYVDTAFVDRADNNRWEYLLGVNVERVVSEEECDIPGHPSHKADTTYGRFLVNLVDSAFAYGKTHLHDNKFINDKDGEQFAKLGFVSGYHTHDTLYVARPNGKFDALSLTRVDNPYSVAKFAFRIVDKDSKDFIIETGYKAYNTTKLKYSEEPGFLKWLNGVVVVVPSKENADIFNLNADESRIPTDNEGIETTEVSVIAGNGSVTINNAAGKTIAISNILGQAIANTVLSSDNATISVPAGIVVVAVEGEAAVKAIVK